MPLITVSPIRFVRSIGLWLRLSCRRFVEQAKELEYALVRSIWSHPITLACLAKPIMAGHAAVPAWVGKVLSA